MHISIAAFLTTLYLFLEVDSVYNGWKCPVATLKRGRVRLKSRGRIAKYSCLRGFQLLGERYSTCLRGRWDSPPPVCISDGCLSVSDDFPHGQTLESYRGGLVKFQCDQGYKLVGSPAVYCNSISWNDTIPVCREITTKAQKWCDFESEDLCGWTQDMGHDFDWKRHNFATPSGHIETGPAFDHTLGFGLDGHYMYLEASNPRLINDTARLLSPVFPATNNSDSCFIFWYHMYGATIGSLKVYVYAQTVSFLFSEAGNHGNVWRKALIPLPPINSSFQIVIEGVRGSGYTGDTAIDDVKLTEGEECADEPITESVLGSCQGRCHRDMGTSDISACDCTAECISKSTCCSDFVSLCGSVSESFRPSAHVTNPPVTTPSVTTNQTSTNSRKPVTFSSTNTTPRNTLQSTTYKSEPNLYSAKPVLALKPSPATTRTSTTLANTLGTRLAMTSAFVTKTSSTNSSPTISTKASTTSTTLKPTITSMFARNMTRLPNVTVAYKSQVSSYIPKLKPTVSVKGYPTVRTSTKRLPIILLTPPPPIVFHPPLTVKQIVFPTRKPLYIKPELNSTKNTMINPYWDNIKPNIPNLGPKPNENRSKILITTRSSPPTTVVTVNTLTTPLETGTVKKKYEYKSKYKRKDIMQAQIRTPEKKFKAAIAAGLGLVTLLCVAAAVTICYIRKRRINRRSSMGDEADVLFLTSDEILDFSLARPSSSEHSVCDSHR